MALARVRGCAGQALRTASAAGGPLRQADDSRRGNGPRKAISCRLITVRLRVKSCLDGEYLVPRPERRAVVATERPRTPQQADVGSKTRSAGRVATTRSLPAEGGLRWTLPSKAGTPPFPSVSAGTLRRS